MYQQQHSPAYQLQPQHSQLQVSTPHLLPDFLKHLMPSVSASASIPDHQAMLLPSLLARVQQRFGHGAILPFLRGFLGQMISPPGYNSCPPQTDYSNRYLDSNAHDSSLLNLNIK